MINVKGKYDLPLIIVFFSLPVLFAFGFLINLSNHNSKSDEVAIDRPAVKGVATELPTSPMLTTIAPTVTQTQTVIATVILPTTVVATAKPTAAPTATEEPTDPPERFACNCSLTCARTIRSCEQAQYLLNSCGCKRLDADHDGVACDAAPLHCQN